MGSHEEKLAKLADPERRQAVREQIPYFVLGPFENIVVTGPATTKTER